jgi:Ca2+-binding RTX toxin-like protein
VTTAGKLDPTFGDGGRVVTATRPDFPADEAQPQIDGRMAGFLADGRVLVAGALGERLALLRYLDDGAPAIAAKVEGGVLEISGTGGGDVIRVRRDGANIEIVGLPQRFAAAAFSRVGVDALDGNDRIDLSALSTPANISGGAGDDFILAGAGADSILGGAGHDTLFGGRGPDTLRGGGGNDYLNAGPGEDSLFGDDGNDQFFSADFTRDRIDGGAGFDRVKTDFDDLASAVEGPFP